MVRKKQGGPHAIAGIERGAFLRRISQAAPVGALFSKPPSRGLSSVGAAAQPIQRSCSMAGMMGWVTDCRTVYIRRSGCKSLLLSAAPIFEFFIDLDFGFGESLGHCILEVLDADGIDSVPLVGRGLMLSHENVAEVRPTAVG